MKLFSISCIKDESDMIETFVRINSKFIDTFIFIDDSEDETAEIIRQLKIEGFKIITLYRDKREEYRQDILLTSAVKFIVDGGFYCDYILPLDCDEFPNFKDLEDASNCLSVIPDMHIGYYFWETYVPIALNFNELKENGLITCFKKRILESKKYEKIIIPFKLGKDIIVGMGAHTAVINNGKPVDRYLISNNLGHFPVRSAAQIIRKNLSAAYGVLRKKSRSKYEGLHIFETLKQIKNSSFEIDLANLQNISYAYANARNEEIILGDSPSWIDPYSLSYSTFSSTVSTKILSSILVDSWITPFSLDEIGDIIDIISS